MGVTQKKGWPKSLAQSQEGDNICSFYLLSPRLACLERSPGCVEQLPEPLGDKEPCRGSLELGVPLGTTMRHDFRTGQKPPRELHILYLLSVFPAGWQVPRGQGPPAVRPDQVFADPAIGTTAHSPPRPPHAAPGPASASPDLPPQPGPPWSSPCVSVRVAQSDRWGPALDEASPSASGHLS